LLLAFAQSDYSAEHADLLALLPARLKGVAFAALTAAVAASLSGKANSIATIYTLDIREKAINKDASEARMVWIGRVTVVVAMLAPVLIAPYMGIGKKGCFQYIQEYTGFVSPGILVMFLLGFFWKPATAAAATFATVSGFVFSVVLKFLPDYMDLSFLAQIGFAEANALSADEMPFLDRMVVVFAVVVLGMVVISKLFPKREAGASRKTEVDLSMLRVESSFALGSAIVCLGLVVVYSVWW